VIGAPGTAGLVTPRTKIEPGGLDARYPVGDGRTVRVILSEVYDPDPAVSQSVASFLGTLLHGGEIVGVTVFLGTAEQIRLGCGAGAEACFNAVENMMLVPAVPPPSGIPQEDILAHEYGHALANGRSNYPFPAVVFGTKRWATYEGVCPRFLRSIFAPGGVLYRDLPGEGFADAYRVVNGGNPGLFMFNRAYFPDATASRLIRQDVLDPWHETPARVHRGAFSPAGAGGDTRRLHIPTPLDGLLRVNLLAAPGADYDLELRVPGVRRPSGVGKRRGRSEMTSALICGSRSFDLTIRRQRGSGPYRLSVKRP
jgi:hypothetical protein